LGQLPLFYIGKSAASPETYEEAFEVILAIQKEGKILHMGLSIVLVK